MPDLRISSYVVVRLAQTIPRHRNHKLFFDNWFSSIPLMTYLAKEGIHCLGTIRPNRPKGVKMTNEKEIKKPGRGVTEEKIAVVDGTKLSVVCWFDNKIVTTISTYAGSKPTVEARHFF